MPSGSRPGSQRFGNRSWKQNVRRPLCCEAPRYHPKMRTKVVAAALLALVSASPAEAWKCPKSTEPLDVQLRSALEESFAVFFAGVLRVTGDECDSMTQLRVIEVFK